MRAVHVLRIFKFEGSDKSNLDLSGFTDIYLSINIRHLTIVTSFKKIMQKFQRRNIPIKLVLFDINDILHKLKAVFRYF